MRSALALSLSFLPSLTLLQSTPSAALLNPTSFTRWHPPAPLAPLALRRAIASPTRARKTTSTASPPRTMTSKSATNSSSTKPALVSVHTSCSQVELGADVSSTFFHDPPHSRCLPRARAVHFYRAELSITFAAGPPFHTYVPRVFRSSPGCKSAEAATEEAAERAVDHLLEVMGAGVEQSDRPTRTKYLKAMVQLVKSLCSGFWELLRRYGFLERVAEEGAGFHAWLRGRAFTPS
jgi:hypothetical protein